MKDIRDMNLPEWLAATMAPLYVGLMIFLHLSGLIT